MANKLPWYTWFHRDWLMDEDRADMNLSERGLYRDCLDLNYANGSIPADPSLLFRLLSVEREEFDRAWVKVSKHFEPTEWDATRLTNPRADEVMGDNKEYRKAQSDHAKKGWEKRRKQKTSIPKGTHSEPTAEVKGTQCYAESDAHTDTEKISEAKASSPPKATPSWASEFAEWWSVWPRKTAKEAALKAYQKLVVKQKAPGLPEFAERHAHLMKTTGLWVEREFSGRDVATVPYPATYLRRMDWLEPPAETTKRLSGNTGSGRVSDAQLRKQRSEENIRRWAGADEAPSDRGRVIEIQPDIS